MFKDLFNKKVFLYKDLSPRDRFLKILELNILPKLESDHFKLLKSGPSLIRTERSFEWIVEFKASKWNSGNVVCQYNPYFTVKNKDYRKYLKSHEDLTHGSGAIGLIGITSGIHHWDKTVFSTTDSEAYFLEDTDFAKYDNCKLVEQIISNIRLVGIPYFQMMSDFSGIKNFSISQGLRRDAPTLIDLCYVLNREEDLKSIFDWYYESNQNCPEDLEEQMKKRKINWLQH